MKSKLFLLLALAGASSLYAGSVTLTFEGVGDQNVVADYYNGGAIYEALSGNATAGPNVGVDFTSNLTTTAYVDQPTGVGNTTNDPSPDTTVTWNSGPDMSMSVAGGFTSLDFFYSLPSNYTFGNPTATIYGATNNVLATVTLTVTGTAGCVSAAYCNWADLTPVWTGVAYSATFGDTASSPGVAAGLIAFDNITLDTCDVNNAGCTPAAPGTPEPSTWLLFGTGAGLMVFGSRKMKLRKS